MLPTGLKKEIMHGKLYHVQKDGSGVMPDIYLPPLGEAVKNGIDRKMQLAKEMIRQDNNR